MSGYARACATLGTVYGIVILFLALAAFVLRSWAPLEGVAGELFAAAIGYGLVFPALARRELR